MCSAASLVAIAIYRPAPDGDALNGALGLTLDAAVNDEVKDVLTVPVTVTVDDSVPMAV